MADGLIELGHASEGFRVARTLEVSKSRGSAHLGGKHTFEISRAGIIVHPRTEARFATPAVSEQPHGRLEFGIEQLDVMLRNGVMRGSTTGILGAPGAGKTIFGLQFLAAGAQRNEPALYFGFYETPPRLIAKAQGIGIPFDKYCRSGLVDLIWQPPLEHSIDGLAERLLDAAERHHVQRVFIDSVDGFRLSAMTPERLTRFFVALTNELRARGVTTLLSEEIDLVGATLPTHSASLSPNFENIIVLRYVEVSRLITSRRAPRGRTNLQRRQRISPCRAGGLANRAPRCS
ncbi:MAG TPA: ATPase domain-containing protein [Kofleriaceae bacterium]